MSRNKFTHLLPSFKISRRRYCCLIINQMEKDLDQLRLEYERVLLLEEEYKKKLENYQEVSMTVYTKLYHLWLRGNQFFSTDYCKSLQVRNFVSSVREDWRHAGAEIARDLQAVQLVSYTTPRVPMRSVLDKIQNGVSKSKETMGKIYSHVNCRMQFSTLHNEILQFIARLQDGDLTHRQFLSVRKRVSHLSELHTSIDLFKENLTQDMLMGQYAQEEIPQTQDISKECLSAFTYVIQLLTGELLEYEHCLNHHKNIESIVRHDAQEMTTISFSSNQQYLNVIQQVTGSSNSLRNYGDLVPEEETAEIGSESGQSRGGNPMSN